MTPYCTKTPKFCTVFAIAESQKTGGTDQQYTSVTVENTCSVFYRLY